MSQFLNAILSGLRGGGNREALVYGQVRLTHGDVLDAVHRRARALAACGLRAGDGVILMARNSPDAVISRLAAQLLGCRYTGLRQEISVPALRTMVGTLESVAFVVDSALESEARELLEGQRGLRVFTHGPSDIGQDLLAFARAQPATPVECAVAEDAPAQVSLTSGTTGPCKGVVNSFAHLAEFQRMEQWLREPGERRFLHWGSVGSLLEQMAIWTLAAGGTVVMQDDMAVPAIVQTVERERITHLFVYPSRLDQLVDHCRNHDIRCTSLRQIEYGSAPAFSGQIRKALDWFGPKLTQGYGQSEVGFISALRAQDHVAGDAKLLRSVGRPFPGVQLEIRNAAGRVLPVGEPGEVWVHSPAAMLSYWREPERTASVLKDGWVCTGDVGRLDARGYLYLVGRSRERILVGIFTVYPQPVEDVLTEHPDVVQAAVVGVPSELTGQAVFAAVRVCRGAAVSAKELRDLVRVRCGEPFAPRYVEFVESLPTTPTGKPDKEAVRAAAIRIAAARGKSTCQ